MKIIVYEKRQDWYECTYIHDDGDDKVKIVFDEPFDAKLTFGESVFTVSSGIAVLDVSALCDGETNPKLFLGNRVISLEGFILKSGAVVGKKPDAEFERRLSKQAEELFSRMSRAEGAIKDIYEKIEQKISF